MSTTTQDPAAALADAFVAKLRDTITPDQFEDVVRKNRGYSDMLV